MDRNAQATEPSRQSTLNALMKKPAIGMMGDVALFDEEADEGGSAPTGVEVAAVEDGGTGLLGAAVGCADDGAGGMAFGVGLG